MTSSTSSDFISPTKIHRGSLKNMVENVRNHSESGRIEGDRIGKKAGDPADMIIEAQPFAPIKGRIRQLADESSKLDVLKQSKNEDNLKKASNGNGRTEDSIASAIEVSSVDSNKLDLDQNGSSKFTTVAPTPLPRTSRTNSMTDPSSSEESSASTGSPRPSPLPRVTIGSGYKVRLDAICRVPMILLCSF